MLNREKACITGLDMDRAELRMRIEERVRAMYAGGLLQEARALLEGGWNPAGTAAQAIGYAEAMACIRGTLSGDQAMEETARRTRQLAKRQMTWFRHQIHVSWVTVTAAMTVEEMASRVSADWDHHGPQPVCV